MPGSAPEPFPGSANDDSFPAECARTHLYAGARCRIRGLPDPAGFAAAPAPIGIALRFSDGVTAAAELLMDDKGEPALAVAAHTTAAGTAMDERLWGVRELRLAGEETEETDEVEVVIGYRQDPGSAGSRN